MPMRDTTVVAFPRRRQQKAEHLCALTEDLIDKIKPPPVGKDASGNPCGVIDYYDRYLSGLILRVNYGGSKVWRVRYYVKVHKDGKLRTEQRLRKLGRYPVLNLQEARDAARAFLRTRLGGDQQDPDAERLHHIEGLASNL